jgi:transposase-like protein
MEENCDYNYDMKVLFSSLTSSLNQGLYLCKSQQAACSLCNYDYSAFYKSNREQSRVGPPGQKRHPQDLER